MDTKRAIGVAVLCLLVGFGVTFATTLEELFIQQTGWMPGIVAGSIQTQHNLWHNTDFGIGFKGREFLEYHRELLAQSDDFRIYGCDNGCGLVVANDGDPDAAVIPVLPLTGFTLRFEHPSPPNVGTCQRPALHPIDDGLHGCHLASYWTGRPANLQSIVNLTGDDLYDYFTVDALGEAITRDFHNQGHGAIGRHQPFDLIPVLSAVKDGAFYQWHKNIDNVYADWVVDKYQRSDKAGLPFFFSVTSPAVGASPSALSDRLGSTAYQGRTASTVPVRDTATQYGASPRIASDIYVGDHAGIGEYKNLVYAAGTRKFGTPTDAWDVDAWSVLNVAKSGANGWFFSVTKDSAGEAASGVIGLPATQRGGAVFESTTAGGGSNLVVRSAADLGLAANDELDALEVDQQRQIQGTNDTNAAGIFDRPKQWFSLRAPVTTGLKAIPDGGGAAVDVGPNDILRFDASGSLVIAVAGAVLGLGATDDLDALAIVDANVNNTFDDPDKIYFSLARLSPALGVNSAADIFCITKAGVNCGGGGTRLEATADAIGLVAGDDLDALDWRRGQSGLSAPTAASILADPTDTGACCHANGTCTEVLSTACVSPGDSFGGFDTVCAAARCASAPGACCAPNGSCTVVSDQICADQAGTFRGHGTTCPPVPACPVPPSNDECANAFVIPYDFVSPYDPPSGNTDNTNATIPVYFRPPRQDDPPYSCNDHKIFSGPYGSGTIWFSYTVPPGSGSAPGPGIEMPLPGRSILLSTQRAAAFYPNAGGAGDTRLGMYYAPNGNCSVLQEVACADNIEGSTSPLAPYADLQYNNPYPGKYYIQVSTVFNVDRGQTYLRVSAPPPPPPPPAPSGIPAVSAWGLAVLTFVLMGAGAILLRLRRRVAP